MYPFPYFMPQQGNNSTNPLDDIERTIKFYENLKKAAEGDKDKKKDSLPKPNQTDVITKALFFMMATPFVMTGWVYLMTQMAVGFLEAIAKIKGLH